MANKTSDTAINTIFNLISSNGSISQTKMFELSGYSRGMISITCEQLLSDNLIVLDKSNTSNKKKNLEYKINPDLGIIIGIGIGGTSCRIGLFNIIGEPIDLVRYVVDLVRGPEAVLAEIVNNIEMLRKKTGNTKPILGIGMAIPSPVKYEEGYANYPAFMPGWHMFDLKKYFDGIYHCPVFVDNEVNTMALEEYQSRVNTSSHVLLCIKVGTGIGAGLVIDNKIYRGENGGGGNIGHIQVPDSTTKCECGKIGCIEAIASAPALLKKAKDEASKHQKGPLWDIYSNNTEHLRLKDIKTAADMGDRIALKLIRYAGESVGEIIGMLTMFLDPAEIIIAGQITQLGPNYLYYLRRTIQKNAYPWIGHNFSINFTTLPSCSACLGAARLCISELFEKNILLHRMANEKRTV